MGYATFCASVHHVGISLNNTHSKFMIVFVGGGLLVDRFHSKAELILALCVAGCGALNAIVPYSRWIELLYALYVIEGWLESIVNIGEFLKIINILQIID